MQKRAIETRKRILMAAIKRFAKYGFAGAGMDQIARDANANKERIYAYYGSKVNLFECCLAHVFRKASELENELRELDESGIPEMTAKILEVYMRIHEKHPEFRRLLAWGNLEEKLLMRAINGVKFEGMAHLRALYEKGCEQGYFKREVSFDTYIFTLTAVSFFYFSNQRTLSRSMLPGLFSDSGREHFIQETVALLAPQVCIGAR